MCVEYFKSNCKMRTLSEEQEIKHNYAKECCICHNKKRPFDASSDDWRKVRNQDHETGYYIGAAHNLCNKRRRVMFQIPIFIQNLRVRKPSYCAMLSKIPRTRNLIDWTINGAIYASWLGKEPSVSRHISTS